MSEMEHERIPTLTLEWRMRMAMAMGELHAQDMADALEVSRKTVTRWLTGAGAPPRKAFIRQWAWITRTDPTWLLTGQQSAPHPAGLDEGLDVVRREGIEPPTRCVIEALELYELAEVIPFPLWKTERRRLRPRRAPLTLVPTTALAAAC